MMKLTSDAKNLINLLIQNGYKAYAVGGCVRDTVIGRDVGDIDITTSAKPEEVEAVLNEHHIRFVETGLKHGTVTAVINGVTYEITSFRSDGKYLDNRHPEKVTFVNDLRLDLARRDFTMNALAYNEGEGIIDVYGGLDDIQNKLIRAVGNPDRRFQEDGLRIMRAIRFSSTLGFALEDGTKRAVFDNKDLLKNIASERLFTELKKLLLGDNAEDVLMKYRDVIAVIIPEMRPCFDFPQNSRWHIYDVYTHTVKSIAVAPKKDYMRLALLFHDIGKPSCKTVDDKGQDHFKGHPKKSAALAYTVLKRLKASNELINKVVTLVENHDDYITERPSNIKKWLRTLGEDLTFDYIDLKIADLTTHNLALSQVEIDTLKRIKTLTKEIIDSNEPYRISDLKLNGYDLMSVGFRGYQIQQELEKLINEVSGNPKYNEKEKLIAQAKRDYLKI